MRFVAFLFLLTTAPAQRFESLARCEERCRYPNRCIETRNKAAICGAPCATSEDCGGLTCRCVWTRERECHRTDRRDELRVCWDAKRNPCHEDFLDVEAVLLGDRDRVASYLAELGYDCKTTWRGAECIAEGSVHTCLFDARTIEEVLHHDDMPVYARCIHSSQC